MKHPTGKGVFIWDLARTAGSDPDGLAVEARELRLQWAAIKISNGTAPFQSALLPMAIEAVRRAGVSVWGWSYVYLVGRTLLLQGKEEAQLAANLVLKHGLDGFLIDGESECKRPRGNIAAGQFGAVLRSRLPELPIGLCSFRFPSLHPEFPWAPLLAICDFHAPQVYWQSAHNPADQLARSYRELKALKDIPFVPTGSAYAELGWQPTVQEIDAFDAKAYALGLPGLSWWSLQAIEAHPDFYWAIANHNWITNPVTPPKPTVEARVAHIEDYLKPSGFVPL